MGPPAEMEVDEVEEIWEIEDVPARRLGSSRDHLKITEFTESAEGNANFHGYVSTSLCFSATLWQIFLPLRGCEEFPIIAGAR
jgi:hypothetical protein